MRERRSPLIAARIASCSLLVALISTGCMMPRDSSQRLIDRARDLNMATRFGRMDVAAEHTAPSTRRQFLERRQLWGDAIRVVDVNLASMERKGEEQAELLVNFAWTRMDEGELRATTVKQYWRNAAPGGWLLEREQRVDGDHGLLGDTVRDDHAPTLPPPDVHFETRTLGSVE
jgi:hypothetical protein